MAPSTAGSLAKPRAATMAPANARATTKPVTCGKAFSRKTSGPPHATQRRR